AATAMMSVMSLACAFAGNFQILMACRFLQGIGVGGEMPVAAAYVSELSKAKGRGRFFMLYEMIFPIGLMATGQIGAWVVPAFGWQAIFWIGGVPALFVTYLLLRLPESPRWLISKGHLKEADLVIKQMEAGTTQRIAPADAGSRPSLREPPTRWTEAIGSAYRR